MCHTSKPVDAPIKYNKIFSTHLINAHRYFMSNFHHGFKYNCPLFCEKTRIE